MLTICNVLPVILDKVTGCVRLVVFTFWLPKLRLAGDKVTPDPVDTISVVEPLIEPEVAVIVVVPAPALVASPCVPEALLIVATAVTDELHSTVVVMFCVLLLLKVPVATNCSLMPSAIEGLAGVTASPVRTGAVTVSVVEPLIGPEVAVIVVLRVATLVATPWLPEELLMVATPVFDELHSAVVVRSWVLLSL